MSSDTKSRNEKYGVPVTMRLSPDALAEIHEEAKAAGMPVARYLQMMVLSRYDATKKVQETKDDCFHLMGEFIARIANGSEKRVNELKNILADVSNKIFIR